MGFYSLKELEGMPSFRLGLVYGGYVILKCEEDANEVIEILKRRPVKDRDFIEKYMVGIGYGELISSFREKFLNPGLTRKIG